jgi:hypothetical protein
VTAERCVEVRSQLTKLDECLARGRPSGWTATVRGLIAIIRELLDEAPKT